MDPGLCHWRFYYGKVTLPPTKKSPKLLNVFFLIKPVVLEEVVSGSCFDPPVDPPFHEAIYRGYQVLIFLYTLQTDVMTYIQSEINFKQRI